MALAPIPTGRTVPTGGFTGGRTPTGGFTRITSTSSAAPSTSYGTTGRLADAARQQAAARAQYISEANAKGMDVNAAMQLVARPGTSTTAAGSFGSAVGGSGVPASAASTGLANAASGMGGAGAEVPVPPPVTSGAGDGGVAGIDSGIDRILAQAGGGMPSVNGLLRAGLGQRSRPMDSYVLAGKKAY